MASPDLSRIHVPTHRDPRESGQAGDATPTEDIYEHPSLKICDSIVSRACYAKQDLCTSDCRERRSAFRTKHRWELWDELK